MRIDNLLSTGIEVEELAEALDVTPASVRNWTRGSATPRRAAARTLDDLRRAVQLLAEGGTAGPEAAQWLRSRQGGTLENDRPLDVVRTDPVRVLAAAHEYAMAQRERTMEPGGLRVVPDQ